MLNEKQIQRICQIANKAIARKCEIWTSALSAKGKHYHELMRKINLQQKKINYCHKLLGKNSVQIISNYFYNDIKRNQGTPEAHTSWVCRKNPDPSGECIKMGSRGLHSVSPVIGLDCRHSELQYHDHEGRHNLPAINNYFPKILHL